MADMFSPRTKELDARAAQRLLVHFAVEVSPYPDDYPRFANICVKYHNLDIVHMAINFALLINLKGTLEFMDAILKKKSSTIVFEAFCNIYF